MRGVASAATTAHGKNTHLNKPAGLGAKSRVFGSQMDATKMDPGLSELTRETLRSVRSRAASRPTRRSD